VLVTTVKCRAIQIATPWAHDIAKCVDAPLQVGRVLCVEKITI